MLEQGSGAMRPSSESFYLELAEMVEVVRRKRGLTQAELAELAGVSRYVVQDLESASGRTTLRRLLAVLRVLDIIVELGGAADEHVHERRPPASRDGLESGEW